MSPSSRIETGTLISPNGRVDYTNQGALAIQWSPRNPNTGEFVPTFYVGTVQKRKGAQVLAPGYMDDIPKVRTHGFGRDSIWVPEKISDGQIKFLLDTNTVAFQEGERYPLGVKFGVELFLDDNGNLYHKFSAKNDSTEPADTDLSLHTYVAVDHAKKREIKARNVPGLDMSQITWDTESPDDTYAFNRIAMFTLPDGRVLTMRDITNTKKRGYDRLQLWSRNPLEDRADHDFFCPEAIGRFRILQPGESMDSTLRLSIAFPQPA